uniref:Uncharacterized protein n=1 Tax=Cucumis melo TaxID=3656 RepID=A0A9I9DT05_CUCME
MRLRIETNDAGSFPTWVKTKVEKRREEERLHIGGALRRRSRHDKQLQCDSSTVRQIPEDGDGAMLSRIKTLRLGFQMTGREMVKMSLIDDERWRRCRTTATTTKRKKIGEDGW